METVPRASSASEKRQAARCHHSLLPGVTAALHKLWTVTVLCLVASPVEIGEVHTNNKGFWTSLSETNGSKVTEVYLMTIKDFHY